jgi:hypothetical protein
VKKKPPRGFVPWNRETFEKLVHRPPEMLESRFDVSHGMVVNVLQRDVVAGEDARGYRALIQLIDRSHASDASKSRLRRRSAALFRSLRSAGIALIARDPDTGRPEARVHSELQLDFSLHNTLALYLVDAVGALDSASPTYALDVLTLVEAILENPRVILRAQVEMAKRGLLAQLKAEGVPYEDRIRQLDEVTHPKPGAEFIYATFRVFAEAHPWVGDENIHPKSIAREIYEGYRSFVDYTRELGLARSEGVLLRYLSQVHNTLVKSVPASARTEEVFDLIAFFRTMLGGVDSSLVEAWETLLHPEPGRPREAREAPPPLDLAQEPRLLAARARAEMHALVRALAAGDYESAASAVFQDPDDPWDVHRLESALAPFFEAYGRIVFTPDARQARYTHLAPAAPRKWDLFQVLVDPEGDGLWAVHGEIDLTGQRNPEGPLVRLHRIGT